MRKVSTYIHERKDWPAFRWNAGQLIRPLGQLHAARARLLGQMETLGFTMQEEASLRIKTLDIVTSSAIEGEILDQETVRSSIARRLGMDIAGIAPVDRHVEGVVEMMLDATTNFRQPLTEERLYGWQAALFPTGRSGMLKIVTGAWRDNPPDRPMQVISGMMGREKVHFQAPDSSLLTDEMYAFLKWFNSNNDEDPLLKAAIAHLWFVTIHPFDDGNGRIARAIADMQLARADGSIHRFYSMSAQIRREKNRYYEMLEKTQKGDLDITAWLCWFMDCLGAAIEASSQELASILQKAHFWKLHASSNLNPRQQLMLNKILDGWEGYITSSNWAKQTNTSSDSAVRDINDLVSKGILTKGPAGGRSTRYALVPPGGKLR